MNLKDQYDLHRCILGITDKMLYEDTHKNESIIFITENEINLCQNDPTKQEKISMKVLGIVEYKNFVVVTCPGQMILCRKRVGIMTFCKKMKCIEYGGHTYKFYCNFRSGFKCDRLEVCVYGVHGDLIQFEYFGSRENFDRNPKDLLQRFLKWSGKKYNGDLVRQGVQIYKRYWNPIILVRDHLCDLTIICPDP